MPSKKQVYIWWNKKRAGKSVLNGDYVVFMGSRRFLLATENGKKTFLYNSPTAAKRDGWQKMAT